MVKSVKLCQHAIRNLVEIDRIAAKILRFFDFWATICKTVCPMLSVRCLSCLSVCLSCPVCNVGLLWPNGWTDQYETWHAGRPLSGHIALGGDQAPPPKGGGPPIFGPYLLWSHGWMAQDATWYGGRPRPKPVV